jgi:hypothetical protein
MSKTKAFYNKFSSRNTYTFPQRSKEKSGKYTVLPGKSKVLTQIKV